MKKATAIPASADPELGVVALRILLALMCFADNSGRCSPSYAQISAATGIDRRNIPVGIRRLEARGHLCRASAGPPAPNSYRLLTTRALNPDATIHGTPAKWKAAYDAVRELGVQL